MARKSKRKSSKNYQRLKSKSETIAIIGLILNVLILPGLGSIIGGKTKTGIWQIILSVIGIILSFIIIGIPILIAVWIWGLITGIQIVQENR